MEDLHINSLLVQFPEPKDNTLEGFQQVKKEYTAKILSFFRAHNYLASTNFVGDVQVYVKVKQETYGNLPFTLYNRFGLKLDYNHIYRQPELVMSYERTMRLCQSSLQQLSAQFAADQEHTASPLPLINKVVHAYYMDDEKKNIHLRVRSIKSIEKEQNENPQATVYDKAQLYPIINRPLQTLFGIPSNNERDKNRYTRYLAEINRFIHDHLMADFRRLIPFQDQFTKVDFGQIPPSSAELIFGKAHHNTTPRYGLNNGTYQQPAARDVVIFFLHPDTFTSQQLKSLYDYFINGYGKDSAYKGLSQYLGITPHGLPKFSFAYNPNDPHAVEHIVAQLDSTERMEHLHNPDTTFLCIYLSPISKSNSDTEKHELYYRVKETLLRRNIASQCIDTNKLLEQINADTQHSRYNFKYSLQNMSVAINAKLGGSPWILAGNSQRDLIIGIGAFRQNNHQYIGAAFVFSNVGVFNQYAYFSQNSIELLAGAMQQKIEGFTKLAEGSPQRLILHYYKQINRKEEQVIDSVLQQLNLDIPVYVLNINETESESVFAFDMADRNRMPISGRYVLLGNNNYLLCNNVRYENLRYPIKEFAFPIKINIYCKTPNALTPQVKLELLTQVYQFSRIYWKSVSQQNLPVTIMYPKMIAEIMPHFCHKGVTEHIPNNRLWFL